MTAEPVAPDEARAFAEVVFEALHVPQRYWEGWLDRLGSQNLRVIRRHGAIVAGAVILPQGQWFGGRAVPCGAISAVGVPAEHRGLGFGREIMTSALRECRDRGLALSVLYASTEVFYRSLGYERAGWRLTYERPTTELAAAGGRGLAVTAVDGTARPAIEALYERHAARHNGRLDRCELNWKRLFDPPRGPGRCYLLSGEDGPEGYVFIVKSGQIEPITVEDYVALTPAALRNLASLLGRHASMAPSVIWRGAIDDPLAELCGSGTAKFTDRLGWMLRLVDVEAALRARGYPSGIDAEVHLAVTDDVLPDNDARFVLRITKGSATVTRGGRGDLQVDVRDLASLYAGHRHPSWLWPDRDPASDALGLLLSGPRPWMSDMF